MIFNGESPAPGRKLAKSPCWFKDATSKRPAGDVPVKVRVAASYLLVNVRPLIVNVSVIACRLNGLLTSASRIVRVFVIVLVSPLGFFSTQLATTGACMSQRGSGSVVVVTTVP